MTAASIKAVLFDLDGTLIDTAGDLVGSLWAACDRLDVPRPGMHAASRAIGDGGAGLVRLAFGADSPLHDEALGILLGHYAEHIAVHSRVYSPLDRLLAPLERRGIRWGIVTNKREALAERLVSEIDLRPTPGCLVGGDTLAVAKPHPDPLLHAAAKLGVAAEQCLYCGDHRRDIDAGRAAAMRTAAAAYGYVADGDAPALWGADHVAATPSDLADHVAALTGVELEAQA